MSGLRGWVVLLAAVSFLAGVPAGILIAGGGDSDLDGREAFSEYSDLLSAEFDLGPERRQALRVILADYQRTLEESRSRQLDRFEDEVVRAGRLCRERIRDVLLPEDARARFDELASVFPD